MNDEKREVSKDDILEVPVPSRKIKSQVETRDDVTLQFKDNIKNLVPLPARLSKHLREVPEEFQMERPYEVDLLRSPDTDAKEELTRALKNMLTLIRNQNYTAAWMVFDIVDQDYREVYPDLVKTKATRLIDLYDEIVLYLWISKAYQLAMSRQMEKLREITEVISRLQEKVSDPIDKIAYKKACEQLGRVRRITG